MADVRRANILVVDDTDTNIDILVEVLGEAYEVLVAMDGPTALEVVAEESPDLILLDVMMPDMDGYEVCKRLKADPGTADIPVIFITAKSSMEDEIKGFEMGAVDFIAKPISPPVVQKRVAATLALKDKTDKLTDLSAKLGKYLSPQVYESIFSGAQDVAIGGGRKKLTVFLSDIVGFTATTERMEPEDMTSLLNAYLDRMAGIAMKYGGTIDKFIGDAVLIFFGDPVSNGLEEDAKACVRMALEMREAIKELQDEWFNRGVEQPFQVRMGINTGYCTVGNFGSTARMDYTIIGSQVNVAARLEQNAQPDQILISHETWSLVKDEIHCTPNLPITVKGVPHPIQTYQVVGPAGETRAVNHAVGGYVQPAEVVSEAVTVREVVTKLKDGEPFDALVIAGDAGPKGVVCRVALEALLCSEADKAMFLDQQVASVMDEKPLVVESSAPLAEVAKAMNARTGWAFLTPVIVMRDGAVAGVLPLPVLHNQLTIWAAECTEE